MSFLFFFVAVNQAMTIPLCFTPAAISINDNLLNIFQYTFFTFDKATAG